MAFIFRYIWVVILPIDELIFFRMGLKPPTSHHITPAPHVFASGVVGQRSPLPAAHQAATADKAAGRSSGDP